MDWKSLWTRLSTFEPAVLRGVWIAIVGVLTAFGLEVTGATQAKATAIIAAASVIVPLLQGLWTRAAVVPVARFAELEDAVTTPMPSEPTITTSVVEEADLIPGTTLDPGPTPNEQEEP